MKQYTRTYPPEIPDYKLEEYEEVMVELEIREKIKEGVKAIIENESLQNMPKVRSPKKQEGLPKML